MSAAARELILVIDADREEALLERKHLEDAGYLCEAVHEPGPALARVARGDVDLVVLDAGGAGDATGFTLFERMREEGCGDVPVVLVARPGDEMTAIQAMRLGIRDYVPKTPAFHAHLTQAVARALAQGRSDRERRTLLYENFRLLDEARAAHARVEILNEIARIANRQLDAEAGIRAVLPPIAQATGAAWVTVSILQAGMLLKTLGGPHVEGDAGGGPGDGASDALEAIGADVEELLAQRAPRYDEDLSGATCDWAKRAVAQGFRARVVIPLLAANEPLGVLTVFKRDPRSISPEDRRFLERVAEQLSVALHNANLYEKLRQAFLDLRRQQDQIVRMEKMRALGEMAGGMAHDFNNALSVVLGFSELLLADEGLAAEVRDGLEKIRTGAHDAAAIVKNVQDFSRTPQQGEGLETVDLNRVVEEMPAYTRHKWRNAAQRQGRAIEVKVETGEVPPIHGRPSELREVLTNFIFNAVDAMDRGGEITLATGTGRPTAAGAPPPVRSRAGYPGATHAFVAIRDEGCGMHEETRRRLFEPFFTTKGSEGNGLGLAVCYGIAKRHGGDIEVDSTLGKGSTFTLWLPIPREARGATAPAPPPPAETRPAGRILVVDDEAAVREVLQSFLRRLGHEAVAAAGGAEALEKLRSGRFDAVFTDLGMPGMNGLELAQEVRREFPGVGVVLVTGWGDNPITQQGNLPGIDLVVSKPFSRESISRALGRTLGRAGPAAPKE